MKKILLNFLFIIISFPVLANHGVQALGALIPIFIFAGGIALMTVISFCYSIYNIKKKSKTIRIWNLILLIPAIGLAFGLFYIKPITGYLAGLFILLKGILIYFGFSRKQS